MSIPKDIAASARRMIAENKQLRIAQSAYERMSRLQYELPASLRAHQWVRLDMSAAPYNALRGAVRSLSNLEEQVTIKPNTVHKEAEPDTIEAKKLANQWERTLKDALNRAIRRKSSFRASVIWNALVYDEIVAQIIHLPTQFAARGLDSVRERAALRYGDWAIKLVDPKSVYIEYSDLLPERALSVTVKTAQELVDFWGDAASKIQGKINKNKDFAATSFFEFDYVDYEKRLVWASPGDDESGALEDDEYILVGLKDEEDEGEEDEDENVDPKPWLVDEDGEPVPFLPWIAVVGGTITDALPEFQRKPLLYPVYRAEQWATANIVKTIQLSQTIAEFGSPRQVFTGPGSEAVEVEWGEPGGRIDLLPGQDYERIQTLAQDPAIREAIDSIERAISDSTVAEVLVRGAPIGNIEAFAAYNLEIQTAIASLGAFKLLGERFFDRVYEALLLIAYYRGEEVRGYDLDVIDSESIDPDSIHVGVALTLDVPADRVQRVQAAIAMSQQLEYPTRRIIETLGDTDPEGAMEEYWKEQLNRADMMGRLERIRKEASNEIQEMAAQMAQEMIQGMMEQQQQQQGPPREGSQPNLMGPQGIEGVEGPGFNPAMGGMPPAMASPEGATREFQQGLTRVAGGVSELA